MKLADELRAIVGADGVAADPSELATFESDAFVLVRSRPDLAVFPRSTDEVARVVRAVTGAGLAIVPRGAGTSLAGGTIAVNGGVCVGLSRMRRILELDPHDRFAHVEAGVVNLHISQAARSHDLHYAPDPSSQMVCTIGGNVATNSGGPHTLKMGVTANHVLGATVVLADGTVLRVGGPYDDAPGGDLLGLIVGSEGTLGIVTEVIVRLTPLPPAVRTQLAVFETIDDAARTISRIIAAGILPAALEMMDALTVAAVEDWLHLGFPRDAGAVLIIELDGIEGGLDRQVSRVVELCRAEGCREIRVASTDDERAELWKARKKSFGAMGRYGLSYFTQDGVVPRSRVPDIMRFVADVAARYRVRIANVIHAGDGNIHPLLMYDGRDPRQVRAVVEAGYEILAKCVELGGSVTGEHGVGIEKVAPLEIMFDAPSRAAQQRVRGVFDPHLRMNPGKLFATGGDCVELLRPPPSWPDMGV